MRRALLLLPALVWTACGSSPGGPTPPTPTPPVPGGKVEGRYLLTVTPAPSCALAASKLTFPMTAAAAGTTPHPGVQVLVDGDGSQFELELLSTETALRGGMGSTEFGILSNESLRAWIRGIASGPVFRSADGRGEVLAGTLAGDIALGGPDGEEGDLGSCGATDHAFSLRAR